MTQQAERSKPALTFQSFIPEKLKVIVDLKRSCFFNLRKGDTESPSECWDQDDTA